MARVILVSPGHSSNRSNRQPWAYIEGIASALDRKGHTSLVVGDGPKGDIEDTDTLSIEYVETVRSPSTIAGVANRFQADVCLWSLGPATSIILGSSLKRVAEQMYAIIPGPLYSPVDIGSQLSAVDFVDSFSYASLLGSSFVPRWWFTYFLRRNFDNVIAPTETILEVVKEGITGPKGIHVPHGCDTGLLNPKQQESSFREDTPRPPEEPYVLNFGPPRTIRGTTDFLDAVTILCDQGLDIKGVVLARIDNPTDREKVNNINRRVGDQEERFQIVDRYLNRMELIQFIRGASVVVLPYRIVQSTVPISIIEALVLGTPVVTTNIQGAKEVVPDSFPAVAPKDPLSLASAIESLLGAGPNKVQNPDAHLLSWEESIQPLLAEVETIT